MDKHVDESQLLIVAQQIRLDLVTVETCKVLKREGIPHAVIKGITTARWLYDPPRSYSDVDLLVPLSRVHQAATVLAGSGLLTPMAGAYGEAAAHSQLLVASNGAEVDLHGSLPAMDGLGESSPDLLWRVLASDLVEFRIDQEVVPALAIPSRCVVLAMHAVASASSNEQVGEDLRRARKKAAEDVWDEAFARAADLAVEAHVRAAIEFVHGRPLPPDAPLSALVNLYDASSVAKQFVRLRSSGVIKGSGLAFRKLFPSREFMFHADPRSKDSAEAMFAARLRRYGRMLRAVPGVIAEIMRFLRRSP